MHFRNTLLATALGQAALAQAVDWPQWRGPTRDGILPLDGESVFTLNVDSAADGIRLHWHAIPGAIYQVITAANAADPYQVLGQAQKLEGQVAAEMDFALPAAQLNQPATFYRLQVTPKE